MEIAPMNIADECIEWDGRLDREFYGEIRNRGRVKKAHRVVWEEENGPIPDGLSILHCCDNPPCINIEHLFLGTRIDNNHDRTTKGRNGGCKLTKEQVLEIRKSTLPLVELSRMYNISKGHISDIRYGIARKDALNV